MFSTIILMNEIGCFTAKRKAGCFVKNVYQKRVKIEYTQQYLESGLIKLITTE